MCPRGRPRGQGRPRGLHLILYDLNDFVLVQIVSTVYKQK